ncbi:Chlorophyll a-b binding protein, chloroplastic [Heracleum sosnowskyi]|uniref:Chlorophyll a-b binding protein, chloroplastic n=1 Tax=Heracleum sosnowskyi TaxID=360622 RepID=A0AAD8M911_9APIA|nr:Chlorophyll a-b binding protein, chloroplastic [Heracleum sosnowskyi]
MVPTVDMIKVNVDASVSGGDSFGIVWIARDHGIVVIEAESELLTGSVQVQPTMGEALGVKEVLSWIEQLNLTQIIHYLSAVADPERHIWFPGSTPLAWLGVSLPGDFGFDPLGLGSDPETLK